jgi:hypothetical protein
MSLQKIRTDVKSGGYDEDFGLLYASIDGAKSRYLCAVDEFEKLYDNADVSQTVWKYVEREVKLANKD